MARNSTAYTEIDFDRPGKQVGFVAIPHSPHEDAWGQTRVPLAVISNGSGPTVILEGGNHGDEYEGPIVLGELIRDLAAERVSGRLIILPAVNAPAVRHGCRTSPVDGLNFNRSFPGDPAGTLTQQIAAYVHDIVMPLGNAFVDLHSGGSSLEIIPSAIIEPAKDPALQQRITAAVRAFDAPMTVVIDNLGDPRTSTSTAVRAGLVTVGTEMGGGGTVSPEALRICRRGVFNVLAHLGVVDPVDTGRRQSDGATYAIPGPKGYVFATEDGVFEGDHALGTEVRAGQEAGRIHFLTAPGRSPSKLTYPSDGILFGRRQPGRVETGNCCLVIASPAT